MSPLGITLLMLVSFAGFAWLCARKLGIVMALQPEVRWDHPAERLRTVLVDGFLQQRMIRREWKPGIMHTVIFLGFMSLLLRKLQLIAIGFDEQGVDCTGSFGAWASVAGQFPGLLFERHGDVQALAVIFHKVADTLFKVVDFGEFGGVGQLLACLLGKCRMYLG